MIKSRYIGDGHPTFNRNPYNWYIKPYYWVDDHPLLYGNNGSLDPSTYKHVCTIGIRVTTSSSVKSSSCCHLPRHKKWLPQSARMLSQPGSHLSACQSARELVVSEKNMLIKVWKKPFGADSNNAGNSHSNNIWKNIWERTCLNSLEMIHDSRLWSSYFNRKPLGFISNHFLSTCWNTTHM